MPSSIRSPRWTARIASRVMVIPLEQTWAMIRGVTVQAPQPVSELVTTNPANTTGLSAPDAPVNGDRYPASSAGREHLDGLAAGPDVHPPVGQVAGLDLDRVPGAADAVEDGHQRVEVVDLLVPVRQPGPGDPGLPVGAAQGADEEPPVVPLQPPVHVRVEQRRVGVARPAAGRRPGCRACRRSPHRTRRSAGTGPRSSSPRPAPSTGIVPSSTRHPPSARTDEADATTSTLRAC